MLLTKAMISPAVLLFGASALSGLPIASLAADNEMVAFSPAPLYTFGPYWEDIHLNEYEFYFYPDAMSDDGTAVIGRGEDDDEGYTYTFYWDTVTGDLKLFPSVELAEERAYAISADGSVVVGRMNGYAARWVVGDTITVDKIFGEDYSSDAKHVSFDGSAVAGEIRNGLNGNRRAVHWDTENGLTQVDEGATWGLNEQKVAGISRDGTTIVGTANGDGLSDTAYRWTAETVWSICEPGAAGPWVATAVPLLKLAASLKMVELWWERHTMETMLSGRFIGMPTTGSWWTSLPHLLIIGLPKIYYVIMLR
ncbi:hypothetical protein [Pseudorhodobacter ferrugineus]|uniref:hypothetical protein n=1 Tax=Pseudorhodobacter ferrugineus TaxID=77008 RepID=UPI000B1081F3|nr:hypothetical protein [Pseudorhodobacter ferrugineus]